MFSIAKLLDGNPEHHRFLTTTVFVFDERTKILAVIQIAVIDKELLGSALAGCSLGPETFAEVIREVRKILPHAKEGTRLIYKEHLRDLKDVEDFAIEHLWPYLDKAAVMGTHEDIAETLRDCLS